MDKAVHQVCYGSFGGEGYHIHTSDTGLEQNGEAMSNVLKLFQSPDDCAESFAYLTTPLYGDGTEEKACFVYEGWRSDRGRKEHFGQLYVASEVDGGYGEQFLELLRCAFDSKEKIDEGGALQAKKPELMDFRNVGYAFHREDLKQILTALYAHKTVVYVVDYPETDFLQIARYVIWEVYRRLPFLFRKNIGCVAGTTLSAMRKEGFPAPYKLIVLSADADRKELESWRTEPGRKRAVIGTENADAGQKNVGDAECWLDRMLERDSDSKEGFLDESFLVCYDCMEKEQGPDTLLSMKDYAELLARVQGWQEDEATDENLRNWLCEYEDNRKRIPALAKAMKKILKERRLITREVITEWIMREQPWVYLRQQQNGEKMPVWLRRLGLYTDIMGKEESKICQEDVVCRLMEGEVPETSSELKILARVLEHKMAVVGALKSHEKEHIDSWWAEVIRTLRRKEQECADDVRRTVEKKLEEDLEVLAEPVRNANFLKLKGAIEDSEIQKGGLVYSFLSMQENQQMLDEIEKKWRDTISGIVRNRIAEFRPESEEELKPSLDAYKYLKEKYGDHFGDAEDEAWKCYGRLQQDLDSAEINSREEVLVFWIARQRYVCLTENALCKVFPWSRWEKLEAKGWKKEEILNLAKEDTKYLDLGGCQKIRQMAETCFCSLDYSEEDELTDFEAVAEAVKKINGLWNMKTEVIFPGSYVRHNLEEAFLLRENVRKLENLQDEREIDFCLKCLKRTDIQYLRFLWKKGVFQEQVEILRRAIYGNPDGIPRSAGKNNV